MKKLEKLSEPTHDYTTQATINRIIDRVNELSEIMSPVERNLETDKTLYERVKNAGYSETDARVGSSGEGSTKTY